MWCVSELRPNSALDMDVPTFVERLRAPIHGYVPYFCNDSTLFQPAGSCRWPALRSSPGYGPPAFGRCNLPHPLPFDFRISDFFEEQYGCVHEFTTNVTAAAVWLDGGLPIQMSMATPSNLLTALRQPAITNFRVSGDFADGGSWDIGWSSMLVWALGAAPSKDTFWSWNQSAAAKTLVPECKGPSGCPPDHSDAGCELHSMLAALSTGPVQPSDSLCYPWGTTVLGTFSGDALPGPPAEAPKFAELQWAWYFVGHSLTAPFTVRGADFWPPIHFGAGGTVDF
eukprot:gene1508-32034_t